MTRIGPGWIACTAGTVVIVGCWALVGGAQAAETPAPPPIATHAEGQPMATKSRDLLAALARLPDQRDHRLVIGQNIGVAGGAEDGYRTSIDDPTARVVADGC